MAAVSQVLAAAGYMVSMGTKVVALWYSVRAPITKRPAALVRQITRIVRLATGVSTSGI